MRKNIVSFIGVILLAQLNFEFVNFTPEEF